MDSSLALVNSVMGVFTIGTYPIRPFLLIAYAVLVTIVWLGMKRIWCRDTVLVGKGGASARWVAWRQRIVPFATAGSLMLLFIIPLILQLHVFHEKGIPQDGFVVLMAGDEITSSQLVHNHFGKIAIEGLLGLIPGSVDVADTGGGLSSHVGAWVPWLLAVLFVTAFAGSLAVAARRICEGERVAQRFGIGMLCVTAFFVALSKAVDGGIVSDGAGIALAAALALILRSRRFARIILIVTVAYLSVLGLLALTGWYESYRYFAFAAARTMLLAAVLLWIHTFTEPAKSRVQNVLLTLTGLGIAIGIGTFVILQGASQREYLARPVQAGQVWLAAYPWEASVPLARGSAIGRLQVYDVSEFAGIPTGLVLDSLNLPYWYYPISERRSSCSTPDRSAGLEFLVLSRAPLTNVTLAGGMLDAEFTPMSAAPNGWLLYEGRISHNPCLPRYMDVLREVTLMAGGSSELVFYDIFLVSRQLAE